MNVEDNREQENQNLLNNNEVNNNNNSIYNNEELNYSKKYTKISLSFIIIILLKIFFYIYISYYQNKDKFVFDFHFIINYNQYYRFITCFFISYGIAHFILEAYITYKLCFYFENMIGTLITLVLIFISFILISVVHLTIMNLLIFLYSLAKRIHHFDLYNEGGFTPLFFLLYTFYFSFEENNSKIFFLLIIFVVKARNSEYILLLLLIFFTPNETIIGNISGIISANILMKLKKVFLPKIIWIKHFEKQLGFNKLFPFYRYLNEDNPIMKKIIGEFDKDNGVDDNENGQQMTELTLLSTENQENHDSQNNNTT